VHPAEVLGLVLRDEASQEGGDTERRAGVFAATAGERARDQCEERAIDERVAIDEKDSRSSGWFDFGHVWLGEARSDLVKAYQMITVDRRRRIVRGENSKGRPPE
jgi:hypothetical protein